MRLWRPSRGGITSNEIHNDSEGADNKLQYDQTDGSGNPGYTGKKFKIKSSVCLRLGDCEQRQFSLLGAAEVNTNLSVYPIHWLTSSPIIMLKNKRPLVPSSLLDTDQSSGHVGR